MNMLEKRDANKASLSGHPIPKLGDKFLHTHTQKERLKNNCWKVRQYSFSAHKLMWYMWGCVKTVFIWGIFYLIEAGNANMLEAPWIDNSHEFMCELQPAALQGIPISSAAQERSFGEQHGLGICLQVHGFTWLCQVLRMTSTLMWSWMDDVIIHYHRQGNISHRSNPTDVFIIPVSSHLQSEACAYPQAPDLAVLASPSAQKGREERQVIFAHPRHKGHSTIPCLLHCRYPRAILRAGAPALTPASLSHTRSMAHWRELLPSTVDLQCLGHYGQHQHSVGTTLYSWFRRVPGCSPEHVDLHGPGLRAE